MRESHPHAEPPHDNKGTGVEMMPPVPQEMIAAPGRMPHLLTVAKRLAGSDALAPGHVASYLIVGGLTAIANLICIHVLYTVVPLPISAAAHYFAAYCGAAEVGIVVNFILNDQITFTRFAGRARPWFLRLLRFHSTCFGGFIVTLMVSFPLYYWLGVNVVVAQAIAIVAALVFNFSVHHLWTYRA